MGKPSTPPAPDYTGAAEKTAAGNIEAARMATKANRINQVTPYGSLTYSQTPSKKFDQSGYQKAVDAYNSAPQSVQYSQPTTTGSGDMAETTYSQQSMAQPRGNAPDREHYMIEDPDAGWTQTTNLTPQAQETLNKQQALSNQYADIAQAGLTKARSTLENPELDLSALPARAMNVGQTAQDAIMSRLNPQFANQEESLRARMANQGITLGSKAYGTEMQQQSQGRNDAMMQAALQGINLDQQNRSSALQEQAYLKDRPLNMINALRSGAQVQNPQFQQFAQQQTTPGANYSGAAQNQYSADMNNYNAQQAQSSGMMGGLFNLGMGLAGLPGAGGSILQGAKGLFG
jgi:hypothetical protein